MLTFTVDSIENVCSLLKTIKDVNSSIIFFNDGENLRKVVGFHVKKDYFEVNGMTEEHEISYEITLIDGCKLNAKITAGSVMLDSLATYWNDHSVPNSVSKYHF